MFLSKNKFLELHFHHQMDDIKLKLQSDFEEISDNAAKSRSVHIMHQIDWRIIRFINQLESSNHRTISVLKALANRLSLLFILYVLHVTVLTNGNYLINLK